MFWKCFEEVDGRDGCLDEVVELMFVGEEGKEERSFGPIYRRGMPVEEHDSFGL